jgi:predicted nucleic acid-binding protein
MKVSDALHGIRQLAFDTAPLIYLVEQHPPYFDRMLFIMGYIDSGSIEGTASIIALAEVLVQPLRTGNTVLAKRYEAVLSNSHHFHLEPTTLSIARRTADLRARYNLRIPDALHIATALDAGCDAFLTNDLGIKRVTEMTILVLDELTMSVK